MKPFLDRCKCGIIPTMSSLEKQPGSIAERLLRWDVRFQRRLGVLATVAAGGLAAAGLPPVWVAGTAAFAAGNFVAAEVEDRAANGLERSRTK